MAAAGVAGMASLSPGLLQLLPQLLAARGAAGVTALWHHAGTADAVRSSSTATTPPPSQPPQQPPSSSGHGPGPGHGSGPAQGHVRVTPVAARPDPYVSVEVLVDEHEGISVVVMNRPQAKNAIGRQFLRELAGEQPGWGWGGPRVFGWLVTWCCFPWLLLPAYLL